jgi:hypothetical protein
MILEVQKNIHDFYVDLIWALPDAKAWIRSPKQLMEDLLLSNPLEKTITLNPYSLKQTAVTSNILIAEVLNTGNNQVNYNRFMQILP